MDNIMTHASSAETTKDSANAGHPKHASPSRKKALRWLRVLLPAVLILLWLVGAGVGGPYFSKGEEVSSNDQTTFWPESAEATQVQELQDEFTDSDGIPAIALFEGEEELKIGRAHV